jgi:hypothetical protein
MGFTFSGGVMLVSVVTTLFAQAFIIASTQENKIEGTSSPNVPPEPEEEPEEPEEHIEEPPNDP